MVCDKCTTKLNKLATVKSASSSSFGTKNKIVTNENKLLTKLSRFKPDKDKHHKPCRICKRACHMVGAHYCAGCSYEKGICAMCGRKIIESLAMYKQSVE